MQSRHETSLDPASRVVARRSSITIKALRKSFGQKTVLSNVSLTIAEGTVCGVVGHNGVGKTTLMRCLSGIEDLSAGEIQYFGQRFTKDSVELKRRLGIMPDHSALLNYLYPVEFLVLSGEMYGFRPGDIRGKVQDLINLLELGPHARTIVQNLSAGSRKKLGFAAAVLHQPRLLLLDEPFQSVDPRGVGIMKQYVAEFAAAGGTVLLVSHMLDTLERVCDEVAILHGGQIAWEGAIPKSGPSAFIYQGRSLATLEALYMAITDDSPMIATV